MSGIDGDDDTHGNVDRIGRENIRGTGQGDIREKVERAVTSGGIQFQNRVGPENVTAANVERSVRAKRGNFDDVAVNRRIV